MIPGIPNLSMLRSVRVLRPLRSLNKLPGLKQIIGSLMNSAGDLLQVMILLIFSIAIFSIFGLLFWRGILHARCRLTPFPIKMNQDCRNIGESCWDDFIQEAIRNPKKFRCIDEENDSKNWTRITSPWFMKGPQDCIWPIDDNDVRVCSLSNRGYHTCPPRYNGDVKIHRVCGSNFDSFGNSRFVNTREPYGYPRLLSGVYIEDLNWGFTSYDNFPKAFLTTFQIITGEGWTNIMYQIIDAWSFAPAVFFFSIEIILGGYIILNLVLAVITRSLDDIEGETIEDFLDENISERDISSSCKSQQSKFIRQLVDNDYHSTFIMACIIFNTIVLAYDHYGISKQQSSILEILNGIFTGIFLFDMVLCNMAYGIKKYWR